MPTVAFIKARRKARRMGFQALYSWAVGEEPMEQVLANYLQVHAGEKFDQEYLKQALTAIAAKVEEIDEKLKPFVSRDLTSVDYVELAILRFAVYEIYFVTDVPRTVAINEALELAKEFGSKTSYKFINGVLDKL